MKLYISLGFCLIIMSCLNGSSENTPVDEDTTRNLVGIKDTSLYLAVGNPDTALVIFLYRECDNYQYDDQREEYGRWNLEKQSLSLLYGDLFQHKSDREARLDRINKNALSFIEEARSVVLSDYNEYKFVSESLEVDYLFRLKDEVLKEILQKMVNDSAVSSQERGAVEDILKEW